MAPPKREEPQKIRHQMPVFMPAPVNVDRFDGICNRVRYLNLSESEQQAAIIKPPSVTGPQHLIEEAYHKPYVRDTLPHGPLGRKEVHYRPDIIHDYSSFRKFVWKDYKGIFLFFVRGPFFRTFKWFWFAKSRPFPPPPPHGMVDECTKTASQAINQPQATVFTCLYCACNYSWLIDWLSVLVRFLNSRMLSVSTLDFWCGGEIWPAE